MSIGRKFLIIDASIIQCFPTFLIDYSVFYGEFYLKPSKNLNQLKIVVVRSSFMYSKGNHYVS